MSQDCGQGVERREWILGTFCRENGQDFRLPKSLFWTFLPFYPGSGVPWGWRAPPSFLCARRRLSHSQSRITGSD